MKKLLLSIITGFFLLSCGGNDGWSNSDKTIFKNAIKQSVPGHISKEMANDFTDCMLEESMNKWSSLEDLDRRGFEYGREWGLKLSAKCMKKIESESDK
tara:strand:+ start:6858 stop:7154 length:297 start_codon:yes stop_codon:yes gene_type:complete